MGTSDGHLYRFLGRKLDYALKAHDSIINTIHSTNEGIITGSQDGTVKIWGPSLVFKLVIDLKTLGSLNPSVKSVCWDNELSKVLVGTDGSEIWELSAEDGTNRHGNAPLEQGHFANHVAGLSVCPNGLQFASVGNDSTMRVWDLYEPRKVRVCHIEMASRACTFSPDGSMLAIGFGSAEKEHAKQYHGKWIIMKEKDFSVQFEARDSRKMITEIKWSPNGEHIAVGSWDNKIYLYDVDESNLQVSLSSVIDQHNSYITHLDFSADSKHLQANCGAYELRFYEVSTGLHISSTSRLKDVVWQSQTCTLGWHVQSIWSPYDDGHEVCTADCTLSSDETDSSVIVSGDNFGKLKLFQYPCTSSYAQSKEYWGHCGHVAKARWAGKGSHLVSLGAYDRAIMLWKRNVDDEGLREHNKNTKKNAEEEILDSKYISSDGMGLIRYKAKDTIEKNELSRPWVAAMVEPSRQVILNPDLPNENLELLHCHGYQSQLVTNTLLYCSGGNMIYPSAKVVVVYNKDNHHQKFFRKHKGQVAALCTSPNGRFVASGEYALRPRIHVWDAACCIEVSVLPEFHRGGIISIAFSDDRKKLVSIGADRDNSMAVWVSLTGEWYDAMIYSCVMCGGGPIHFACFTNFKDGQNYIVSGGQDQINFWLEKSGKERHLSLFKGIFGDNGTPQTMLCGVSVGNHFVTGTPSGHLFVWQDRKLARTIKAHDQSVNCLRSFKGGFVTGGEDGHITIWSDKFEQIVLLDLNEARPLDKSVCSVSAALDSSGNSINKVLIGTHGGEIFEVSLLSENTFLVSESHCRGEVWGLAMHPIDSDIYATCGDDCTVRIWSIKSKQMLRKHVFDCKMRAISFSNDGKELLVGCGGTASGEGGTKDGLVSVFYI